MGVVSRRAYGAPNDLEDALSRIPWCRLVVVQLTPAFVADQERIASNQVGRTLSRVSYITLDVEGYRPVRNEPSGDSVDFGVDLDFDGESFFVGWCAPTADLEGLCIAQDTSVRECRPRGTIEDVSANSRWSSMLGTQLSGVKLDWRPRWEAVDDGSGFLVGIHLRFGNQQDVTLALADVEEQRMVRSATNVLVVFRDVPVP